MPRQVEFQGTVHEFPDNASDDQVRSALMGHAQDGGGVMSHVANFAKNFWGDLTQSGQGLVNAVKDPIGAVKGIGAAQDAVRLKAADAMKRGDYVEAARHAINYLIPVAGPGLDARGDQAQSGDVSGALGGTASMALQLAGPKLLEGVKIPVAPGIVNPNPTEGAALNYLESKGVPVPAGAKTGNSYVKGLQKAADSTPLGAVVAQRAGMETTKALQAEAESLATRTSPNPVVPEQAGAGIRNALSQQVGQRAAAADTAYEQFRQIEAQKPMPVDVSQIKAQLEPIYQDMQKWMEPAKRNTSAGFQAIKSIVEGPDSIPASQAETGLGGLKQLGREGLGRNAGLAKFVTPKLQSAIDQTVAGADPAAAQALQTGRSATAAQYGTQAVLDDIRSEPVQAFGQMVYAKDAGVDLLRKVQKEAPGELPKVGRAWLEDLFGKAQSQGGFTGADGLFAKWRDLGPQTKHMLFQSPQLVSDLDKFFLGAKRLAENPNPSGTAVVGAIAGSATMIVTNPGTGIPLVLGAGALSKMLHSPAGIRALTQGMDVPLSAPGAAVTAGQLLKMAGSDVRPLPAAASQKPQTEIASTQPSQLR